MQKITWSWGMTLVAALAGAAVGCGSAEPGDDSSGSGGAGTGGTSAGAGGAGGAGGEGNGSNETCEPKAGTCELVDCAVPDAGISHTAACAVLSYTSNPPTSGTHYEVWAAYEVYDAPVPRGFLVHSLEHGAVILSYNCELAEAAGVDCAQLAQQLQDFHDNWPSDAVCDGAPTRHRLLVTPDPLLDVPFAAAAWGHYLKGSCFDEELVSSFVTAHYAQTVENICNGGIDPASYPADCGE